MEVTNSEIVQPTEQQKIEKLEEAPIEPNDNAVQTKTRFSGRKNISDFLTIETKVM